jgi:hypothetical protein
MARLNTIGPSLPYTSRSTRSSFPVQMHARFPVVRPERATTSVGASSIDPPCLAGLVLGPSRRCLYEQTSPLDVPRGLNAEQPEAPATGTRELLTALGDRLHVELHEIRAPHNAIVDPDTYDNVPFLPPPESRSWPGRARREPAPYGVPRRPIEARPPALRARCGRLVYQYESTASIPGPTGETTVNEVLSHE